MIRHPARARYRSGAAVVLVTVALGVGVSACSGTTSGDQGPADASTNQPAPGQAPSLGAASQGGVTVSGTSLSRSGSGIAVTATVTTDHPDRLVSITSNYSVPTRLSQPLTIAPSKPALIDQSTAVLQPNGPIDSGATVAVTFTFATAGAVQVYGTYRS